MAGNILHNCDQIIRTDQKKIERKLDAHISDSFSHISSNFVSIKNAYFVSFSKSNLSKINQKLKCLSKCKKSGHSTYYTRYRVNVSIPY